MKKKLAILGVVLVTSFLSYGQFDIRNIYGGANIGYANPTGDFSKVAKGGFCYNLLAGYKLNDNIAVGLEYGSAITASFDSTGSTGLFGLDLFALNNYLLKGWYFVGDGAVKPYASVGIGIGTVQEPDLTIGGSTLEGGKGTGLGASGEIGLLISNVNLSYSFNLAGKGPSEPVFTPKVANLTAAYHRFAIGYFYNF